MNKSYPYLLLLTLSASGCTASNKQEPEQPSTIETKKQESMNQTNQSKRITTPSGLQYEVIKSSDQANAKKPEPGKSVTVHYTGWLADATGDAMGKEFDSSHKRNQPFTFTIGVGRVIKGWDEGVMDMKVGEKRKLIIPAELAYGSRGAGAAIPPNAPLVFEVELLDVK